MNVYKRLSNNQMLISPTDSDLVAFLDLLGKGVLPDLKPNLRENLLKIAESRLGWQALEERQLGRYDRGARQLTGDGLNSRGTSASVYALNRPGSRTVRAKSGAEIFDENDPLQNAGLSAAISALFRKPFGPKVRENLKLLVPFGEEIESDLNAIEGALADRDQLVLALARKIFSFWDKNKVTKSNSDFIAFTFKYAAQTSQFAVNGSLIELSFYLNPFEDNEVSDLLASEIWNLSLIGGRADEAAIKSCVSFLRYLDMRGVQITSDTVLPCLPGVASGRNDGEVQKLFQDHNLDILPNMIENIYTSSDLTGSTLAKFREGFRSRTR